MSLTGTLLLLDVPVPCPGTPGRSPSGFVAPLLGPAGAWIIASRSLLASTLAPPSGSSSSNHFPARFRSAEFACYVSNESLRMDSVRSLQTDGFSCARPVDADGLCLFSSAILSLQTQSLPVLQRENLTPTPAALQTLTVARTKFLVHAQEILAALGDQAGVDAGLWNSALGDFLIYGLAEVLSATIFVSRPGGWTAIGSVRTRLVFLRLLYLESPDPVSRGRDPGRALRSNHSVPRHPSFAPPPGHDHLFS